MFKTLTDKQILLELKEYYTYNKISEAIGISSQTITNFINDRTTNLQKHISIKLRNYFNLHVHKNMVEKSIPDLMQIHQDNIILADTPEGPSKIIGLYIKPITKCYYIATEKNNISCSENHLIKNNNNWVEVKKLKIGDSIITHNGLSQIINISELPKQIVYDLTIENKNNEYWCGGVLSHNCGKTLIANQIIANAQKKDPDVWAVVWDSENAFDAQMAKSMNANINKIKHCPVETVEACRNEISTFLDNIKKDKSLHGKIIIVIDSLGNLASTKELEDAAKGKTAVDMGLRAKTCLDPNTQVLMADGTYKKIKNIKKGDKVVTHLKRIKKIEDKWDTLHKKIITIKTKNDEIKLSLTHKLLINRNGDFKYIQAKDIKKTDKLVKIT
jgi:hypothetical protein